MARAIFAVLTLLLAGIIVQVSARPRGEGENARLVQARTLLQSADEKISASLFEEALSSLEKLIQLAPRNIGYWKKIADVRTRLGRHDEAVKAWETVALLSSKQDSCPALGLAYRAAGRREMALREFRDCLLLSPNDPDLLLYSAIEEETAGNLDVSEKLLVRGLSIAPNYTDLKECLIRVRRKLHR